MAKHKPNFQVFPEDFNETRLTNGGMEEIQPVEVVRERKKRRVQLLTYDKLVDRMDACAKSQGLSRAEFFEKVMGDYLDRNEV